jgi:acyl-CoA thioester hydrolase
MTMRDVHRSEFRHFISLTTRWMDNDIYGHVNNVHYYSYFDTAVNRFLIEQGVLDIHKGETVGFVVDTGCSYFSPLAFPDTVHVGLRVDRIGRSSVRYELGLFRNNEERASAAGHLVHVYVDRHAGRSAPIPEAARRALESIAIPGAAP